MGKDAKGVMRGQCRVGSCDCSDYVCPTQPNNFRCEYCGHYPADHLNTDMANASSFVANPYASGAPSPYASSVSVNPYASVSSNPYASSIAANPYASSYIYGNNASNPYGGYSSVPLGPQSPKPASPQQIPGSPVPPQQMPGSPASPQQMPGSPASPQQMPSAAMRPTQQMPIVGLPPQMPSAPAPQQMPVYPSVPQQGSSASNSQWPPQSAPYSAMPSATQPKSEPDLAPPPSATTAAASAQTDSPAPHSQWPSPVYSTQQQPKPQSDPAPAPAPAPAPVPVPAPAPASPATSGTGDDPFAPAHDPFAPTHDPFAPTHDPFAPSHDPFASSQQQTGGPVPSVHDPFAPQHDPFASSSSSLSSSNPFAGRTANRTQSSTSSSSSSGRIDLSASDIPLVSPPPAATTTVPTTEPGGWPIGTIEQIKVVLPEMGAPALNKAMTEVDPSKGVEALLNHCLEASTGGAHDSSAGGNTGPETEWPSDIVDRLAEALPEDFSRERIAKVVASYHPKGDVDGVLALLFSENDSVPSFECQLCFTEYKVDEMYTVDCPSSHRFCFDCIQRMIEMNIRENTPVKCPGEGCDHTLNEDEVRQISQAAGSKSIITREMIEKYSEQVLMRCVKSIPGIIGCPTPGCSNWIEPSDITRKERCLCSSCGACFCSLCKGPYHYHCDCNDVRKHQQRWMEWVTSGRMRYNHDKAEAVAKINAARAEIDRRNEEIMKKYNDMLADEQFKRENGRYCPKCHRVIIKEGGCDLMICGRNWHGGNIQDGCGHHFKWSEAKPYQSTLAKPNQEEANIDIPEIAREFVHTGVVCDKCRKEIKGLRFSCLNCPSCDFCEKCEMEGTMAHPKDHIFQIIAKEQYDS